MKLSNRQARKARLSWIIGLMLGILAGGAVAIALAPEAVAQTFVL